MKRTFAALSLVLGLALAGCMSDTMQGFVGHDIREVIADYGPPVHSFDMPNGTRAFQWHDTVTYTSPAYVETEEKAKGDKIKTETVITPASVNTEECYYTYFAQRGAVQGSWIITGFKPPRFECE